MLRTRLNHEHMASITARIGKYVRAGSAARLRLVTRHGVATGAQRTPRASPHVGRRCYSVGAQDVSGTEISGPRQGRSRLLNSSARSASRRCLPALACTQAQTAVHVSWQLNQTCCTNLHAYLAENIHALTNPHLIPPVCSPRSASTFFFHRL
jgi:hypothetical protein